MPNLKNQTGWDTLKRKLRSKKISKNESIQKDEVGTVYKQLISDQNVISMPAKNQQKDLNIQARPLPKIPQEDNQAFTSSISSSEVFQEGNRDTKEPDYANINELFPDSNSQNNLTGSSLSIWNNLSPGLKKIVISISSSPIFKDIKSAIKESLGNKNDCRYNLAMYIFNSLMNTYKEKQENLSLLMDEVDTRATFEKVVSMIREGWDELLYIEICNSDCNSDSPEDDYMKMADLKNKAEKTAASNPGYGSFWQNETIQDNIFSPKCSLIKLKLD